MEILKADPENTLIIEDSEKGYKAAKNSKAHVLKVNNFTEVNRENILNKINKIQEIK